MVYSLNKITQSNNFLKLSESKQKDQDVKIIDYADKAMVRLQKKYHCMILRGVSRNIAITAIARELSCFVWRIETGHLDFFINRFKKILRKEK